MLIFFPSIFREKKKNLPKNERVYIFQKRDRALDQYVMLRIDIIAVILDFVSNCKKEVIEEREGNFYFSWRETSIRFRYIYIKKKFHKSVAILSFIYLIFSSYCYGAKSIKFIFRKWSYTHTWMRTILLRNSESFDIEKRFNNKYICFFWMNVLFDQ